MRKTNHFGTLLSPPAATMEVNFGTGLNADKQDELDRQFRESQKNARATKSMDDPNNVFAAASGPLKRAVAPAVKAAAAAPKLDKHQSELLVKGVKSVEDSAKVKMALLHTYEAYHRKEVLKPYLPRKLALTAQSNELDIRTALDGCRQALNTGAAAEHIREMYPQLVDIIIQVLAYAGLLEHLQIPHAHGAGAELKAAMNSSLMEQEMAEMEVELENWFAQPWYTRLVYKTYVFVKAHSDGKVSQTKTPSPEVLAALRRMKEKAVKSDA